MHWLKNRFKTVLHQGGVFAYPTEAVWGLGCDPWNKDAVYRLLNIKKRSVEKGMILIASSVDQISPLMMQLNVRQRKALSVTWPGHYTWLFPDPEQWSPDWIRGKFKTVAVRVSKHSVVKRLCEQAKHPLVSTSANRAGEPSLMTKTQVSKKLGKELDLIIPGKTGFQKKPSEIRDLQSGQVVRSCSISN